MNLRLVAAIIASMLALPAGLAWGQPAGPKINPANGLPESGTGELTPVSAMQDATAADADLRSLTFNHRYDDALQRCLDFHNKYQTSGSLVPLLQDWVELGRRFPKAKAALVEIRDRDVREFAAGRGFADLFSEINSISSALNQDGVTLDLFKSFRDKDPQLAQQCYYYVEGLLVAKGEYQWCYDHMGDPQAKFDSIHRFMTMQTEQQKRMAAMNEANKQRLAEMNRQRGWTNSPAFAPPDTSAMMKQSMENGFVGQTRQLIEILVGTGHKEQADKIRDQALTILDDERLKSAVADAEAKVKKAI